MSESDCVEVETSKKQGVYVCQRLCALGKGWQETAHAFYLSLKDYQGISPASADSRRWRRGKSRTKAARLCPARGAAVRVLLGAVLGLSLHTDVLEL